MSFLKNTSSYDVPYSKVEHLALILDGNRRWAVRQNLPLIEGHRQGAETLRSMVQHIAEAGVKYLTVYAFSTENWNRSKLEVTGIMQLFL